MKKINIAAGTYKGLPWHVVDVVATTNYDIFTLICQTINGILISANTRILLAGQTNAFTNGIYIGNIRSPEMEVNDNLKYSLIFDNNKRKIYYLNTSGIVETDTLNWTQMANNLDFAISNPQAYQMMHYNGTNWVNQKISFCAPLGELNYMGSYVLNLTNRNQWYQAQPTATLLSNNSSYTTPAWTSPSAGQIQWIYPENGKFFHTAMSISLTSSGSRQEIEAALYQNGSIITTSIVAQYMDRVADKQMFSFHVAVNANQNDIFDLRFRNTTSSNKNLTFNNFNMVLMACCSYNY